MGRAESLYLNTPLLLTMANKPHTRTPLALVGPGSGRRGPQNKPEGAGSGAIWTSRPTAQVCHRPVPSLASSQQATMMALPSFRAPCPSPLNALEVRHRPSQQTLPKYLLHRQWSHLNQRGALVSGARVYQEDTARSQVQRPHVLSCPLAEHILPLPPGWPGWGVRAGGAVFSQQRNGA